MIGDPQHLAFEVCWPSREPAEVRGLGWGDLTLWFAGRSIWTSGTAKRPVAWTWVDLIEHLARAWGHLLYEEVFPFGLVAPGPEDLRTRLRLASVRGKTPTEVEDAVHAFQHRHDLAAALKGVELPSIWLLREGTQMRVRAQGRDLWRPWNEIATILEKLVDTIRARVVAPASRAKLAFERWDARVPDDELVTRLRTGLSWERRKSRESVLPDSHRYRVDYFLDQARALAHCPRCRANPGSPCVSRLGKVTYPHKARGASGYPVTRLYYTTQNVKSDPLLTARESQ
jgi:hypothetical protein